MPIAAMQPMSTVHMGKFDGRLSASSSPVRNADPLARVNRRRSMKRFMMYSTAMHPAIDAVNTMAAPMPNCQSATAVAGRSARATFHMHLLVVCGEWM